MGLIANGLLVIFSRGRSGPRTGQRLNGRRRRRGTYHYLWWYVNGMKKERIAKDDGRYLIYYRFDDEEHSAAVNATGSKKSTCQTGSCDGTGPDDSSAGKGCGTCRN